MRGQEPLLDPQAPRAARMRERLTQHELAAGAAPAWGREFMPHGRLVPHQGGRLQHEGLAPDGLGIYDVTGNVWEG